MKKNVLAIFAVLALSVGILTGCGGKTNDSGGTQNETQSTASGTQQSGSSAGSSTAAPAHANELNVGIAQDLDSSLDPHKAVAAGTREIMFNVFEGLVKPAPDGSLIPAVAESYTVSDDHQTYTFTIRDGIKYHNGNPVTAEDAKYSIERCISSEEAGVQTVPALSAITGVETPDEKTVVLHLNQPATEEFLSYLTVAIIPADYTEQDTKPVGTGPFKFVSRTAQESVVLERFDDYWGEKAKLDKVTCRIIENGDSILMSLQSGAVDFFSHLTTTQASQLGDDFNVTESAMNLVQALYLNNKTAPFDDVRVRQALCYAIDKQGIIDFAFDGYGFPIGSSMYPAFGKYFLDELTNYYPHDTEKAKALLSEAGYPNGFAMTITVPSNYQPHMDTAQVIVDQLKAVGIDASINPVDWGKWLSDVYQGRDFQSTVIGVDASYMNARALLERFTSESGINFMNYQNEEYDQLFATAQTTYDDAAQTELYKDLERNLTENAANVYIQDMADLVATRKGLTGLTSYPLYALDLSVLSWEG